MKRLLTLALVATAAALVWQRREAELAREETEEIRADLMWSQDAQHVLMNERDNWQSMAREQAQALVALAGHPGAPAAILPADGGVWVVTEGWHAPIGPFTDAHEAADRAEAVASERPGHLVYLLANVGTVTVASTPEWDHGDSG